MDQKILFGVGGVVLGVAVGFGAGWFARSPAPASASTSEPVVAQPSGNLTKENAKKLIDADYAKDGPTNRCWIDNLMAKSDTKVALPAYEKIDANCVEQLSAEGIVTLGECLDKASTGQCFQQVVNPGPKAKNDGVKNQAIAFDCGTFEVFDVTSVTTEGNKAKATFEREFKPGPVLSKLTDCKIGKPEVGRAKKEWNFERDDAGNWRRVNR
jgi:hypothetical protein